MKGVIYDPVGKGCIVLSQNNHERWTICLATLIYDFGKCYYQYHFMKI